LGKKGKQEKKQTSGEMEFVFFEIIESDNKE
jgi:hypothetical protein